MKNVLMSFQPEWVAKILNGEKTIDVRKVIPKCDLPCKVYMYCTKSIKFQDIYLGDLAKIDGKYNIGLHTDTINGKVVAEFTLKYSPFMFYHFTNPHYDEFLKGLKILEKSCLTKEQLINYAKGRTLYGLHIDDLKIYDEPKELNEFYRPLSEKDLENGLSSGRKPLTKAPQNFVYVEELNE